MNPITGRITSFQPLPLSVLLAGVAESISAQAEGQLPENGSGGEPALYELTLTLSTDDMTTRQTAGRTSASSQYLWTADREVPWQLGTSLAVSDWPEGWYEVTARLTCRKKAHVGWGPQILLDASDSMYRIGDPRENQPYGFVRNLSPAETSFTRQGFVAHADFQYGVVSHREGDAFLFDVRLEVRDPTGAVQSKVVKSAELLRGGQTRMRSADVVYSQAAAVAGTYTVTAIIEACPAQRPLGAKEVVRSVIRQFEVLPPPAAPRSLPKSGVPRVGLRAASGMSSSYSRAKGAILLWSRDRVYSKKSSD